MTQEENDGLSHRIARALETDDVDELDPGELIIVWDEEYDEALQAVESNSTSGFLSFPEDFTDGISLGYGSSIDVVVDVVAGPQWPELLEVLKVGARYVCAGAIAGPMVELDMRLLYLKDLTLIGCTFQQDVVFENLVRYIEKGEIKPVVSKTYPLKGIVKAQKDFLDKRFVGKLVLLPNS